MRQKRRQDGGRLACRLRYFSGNVALVARDGKFRRPRLAAYNRSKAWPVSIDKRTDSIVLAEITRLRNGGAKADATDDTRRVVERLTGLPYERCWR